jgi:hypothetical protein
MDYLELIRAEEEAKSKLKNDYPKLILEAHERVKKENINPERIIEIQAWITYSDDIRGYKFSGSSHETIYRKDGHHFANWAHDLPFGEHVKIGENDYHLEILASKE